MAKPARSTASNMSRGNPYALLLRFSLPLLLGNILQQVYNMVDSVVVGNFIDHRALAAVGAGFPFIFLLTALFMGIGIGGMVIVSQYFGAEDHAGLQRTVGTVYLILPAIILPLSLIGFLGSRPFLSLLNVPDDGTLQQATIYLQVIFVGMLGSMGYNINAGLLQGIGDGVSSLKLLGLATAINIALDLLFTIVFGMGVFGVALATVIAQWTSWLLSIVYINRRYPTMRIHPRLFVLDRDILRRALKLGIPSGLQQMIFSLGAMAMSSLINGFGSTFMAGFTSANRIDSLVFLPINSFATATTTYVGQNVGARRVDRIWPGLRAALVLSVGSAMLLGFALWPLSHQMLSLFTSDQGVITVGGYYLQTVLPFYGLLALLFMLNAALRGGGQTIIPMVTSFIGLILVRIPTAYLIAHIWGERYIYLSYAIGWLVGCLITLAYYRFSPWRARLEREATAPPQVTDPASP